MSTVLEATVDPRVEAVSLAYAGWPRRALALVVDAVVLWTAWAVLERIAPVPGVLAYLLVPAYFTVGHGRRSGRTLGKAALGIAVRNARTLGPLGYRRALARWVVVFVLVYVPLAAGATAFVFGLFVFGPTGAFLLLLVCVLPSLLAVLSPLWGERSRAWHDRAAGTIVVRT